MDSLYCNIHIRTEDISQRDYGIECFSLLGFSLEELNLETLHTLKFSCYSIQLICKKIFLAGKLILVDVQNRSGCSNWA